MNLTLALQMKRECIAVVLAVHVVVVVVVCFMKIDELACLAYSSGH